MMIPRQVPVIGPHKLLYLWVDTGLGTLRYTPGHPDAALDYRRWQSEPDRQWRIAVAYVHESHWRHAQEIAHALEMAEWFAVEGEDGGLIVPPAIADALWARVGADSTEDAQWDDDTSV